MTHYEHEPTCQACRKKIELGMPIVTYHGDMLHRWCYEALRREDGEISRRGDAE